MVRASAAETNPDGGSFLGVGRHHVMCESQEVVSNDKGMQVVVVLECLASSNPEMVGKKRKEYFDVDGAAAGRLWTFAIAIGIATHEQWKAAKDGTGSDEIDETLIDGRQLCIECRDETYQGKTTAKTGFRMWSLDSKEAADIPKEPTFLAMWQKGMAASGGNGGAAGGNGGGVPTGGGNGNGNGGPKSPATQPAGAGGGNDPFGKF